MFAPDLLSKFRSQGMQCDEDLASGKVGFARVIRAAKNYDSCDVERSDNIEALVKHRMKAGLVLRRMLEDKCLVTAVDDDRSTVIALR